MPARLSSFVFAAIAVLLSGCAGPVPRPLPPPAHHGPQAPVPVPPAHNPPWPGDPAPNPAVREWLQAGAFDGQSSVLLARDDRWRGITAMVAWTTWCPMSFVLLTELDQLQAKLRDRGVRIVAITPEPPAAARTVVQHLALSHLAVASVVLPESYGRYGNQQGRLSLPFAWLSRHDEMRDIPILLWFGPAWPSEDDPQNLEQMLAATLAGSYDWRGTRLELDAEAPSRTFVQELFEAHQARDLKRLRLVGEKIRDARWPAKWQPRLCTGLNTVAWNLLTDEPLRPDGFPVALELAEVAMSLGAGERAAIVDTYARALFENGQVKRAVEEQRKAIALLQKQGEAVPPDYLTPLARYESAWCNESPNECRRTDRPPPAPPDKKTAPATPLAVPTHTPLVDGIGELGLGSLYWGLRRLSRPPQVLVVRPPKFQDRGRERRWQKAVEAFPKPPAPVKSVVRYVDELKAGDRLSRVMVLFGTPREHPIIEDFLERVGAKLDAKGLQIEGRRFDVRRPVLLASLPNPINPNLPVVIATAWHEADLLSGKLTKMPGHNRVAFVLGSVDPGKGRFEAAAVGQLRLRDTAKDGHKHLQVLPIAQTLSRQQATDDLHALRKVLHSRYAAYDETDWQLKAKGSSWHQRTSGFAERIAKQATWTLPQYASLLEEYLAVVRDRHLRLALYEHTPRGVSVRNIYPLKSLAAFFTDVRARDVDGQKTIIDGPEQVRGATLPGVPVLPDPKTVRPGVSYLFPTWGKGKQREYLLGTLQPPSQAVKTLHVPIRPSPTAPPGSPPTVGLDVHRGRVALERRGDRTWSLDTGSPPILSVRTMDPRATQEVPETADQLRDQPAVVLDLRANGGGSDSAAMGWSRRFSRQAFRMYAGAAQFLGHPSDPKKRWTCRVGLGSADDDTPASGSAGPAKPYAGRLFVLIDRGVCSAGETFANLASQVSGATLVGENTEGCGKYGNVDRFDVLPHSHIAVHFGRTRFEPAARSFEEGVGFFPDIWLDTTDPIEAIRQQVQ